MSFRHARVRRAPRRTRRGGPARFSRPGVTALAVLTGGSLAVLTGRWLAASGAAPSPRPEELFPHAEHEGLFPTCLGCHAGIPEGDTTRYYGVSERDCTSCHDGRRSERVEWRSPARAVSNLAFSHPEHAEIVRDAGAASLMCEDCHAAAGAESRMELVLARWEACAECHAEQSRKAAAEHLAGETECEACHRPLVEATRLPTSRLAEFPVPSAHEERGYLLEHGEAARDVERCGVCHASESCARCHLNADRQESIRALGADDRVRELIAWEEGEWPEPPSHRSADFALAHADEGAAGIASCGNCHARRACVGCHLREAAWLAELPRARGGAPVGVTLESVRPPGHDPSFGSAHGAAAAAQLPECSVCHRETECSDCHDRVQAGALPHALPPSRDTVEKRARPQGPARSPRPGTLRRSGSARSRPGPDAGFHPVDFVLRHGAEAFAAETECADCHSREVFCRSCHERSGFAASRKQTGLAFHNAQPDWLLTHGQAARQNLEACVSCHRQRSCLRCHSARAGLRVSPHGSGFDGERVARRSTAGCAICHLSDQIPPPR